MLVPHRASVLVSAALAVASLYVAAAEAAAHAGDVAWQHGVVHALVGWPALLLARLPTVAADVLATSPLHLVLLYFGGYLLAWFALLNLHAAIRRRGRIEARR